MEDMRWPFPWAVMVSFELQLHGWPLTASKTHLPLPACPLPQNCHCPQQTLSPILTGPLSTHLWGNKQRTDLLCMHLANESLQVDKLCPLWQTKGIVYMTPIFKFFHDNGSPASWAVAVWPPTYWPWGWPSDPARVREKQTQANSETVLDALMKGSTCGCRCLFLFSYLRRSPGVGSATAILWL